MSRLDTGVDHADIDPGCRLSGVVHHCRADTSNPPWDRLLAVNVGLRGCNRFEPSIGLNECDIFAGVKSLNTRTRKRAANKMPRCVRCQVNPAGVGV